MKQIEVVYAFNDKYAELAAVSMTSLLHNTKRDCHIHIFENSVSTSVFDKLRKLETLYANAKITVHHIADELFEELADTAFGKEVWYKLLVPEILCDVDKALVLDCDTLVCRDISELYDIELGNSYAAVSTRVPEIEQYDLTAYHYLKDTNFNAGVMLYNIKRIRETNIFNMEELVETANHLRANSGVRWLPEQSYLNYIFDREHLIRIERKYNSTFYKHIFNLLYPSQPLNQYDLRYDFNEMYEAINSPVIVHYTYCNPNTVPEFAHMRYDFRYLEWWKHHALSPFANPQEDKARLDAVLKHDKRYRGTVLDKGDYIKLCLFDDFMEAASKLRKLSEAGMKILVYGAGVMGVCFIRLARYMDVKIDLICDLKKSGITIDGMKVRPPKVAREYRGKAIMVIAIERPQIWSAVYREMIDIGFPEHHLFPILEPLACGGRSWVDVLESVKL